MQAYALTLDTGRVDKTVVGKVIADTPGIISLRNYCTITCGAGMAFAFYQWVTDSLNDRATWRDLGLMALDYRNIAFARIDFRAALIEEVSFPALDANGKDPAKLTVKFASGAVDNSSTETGKIELGGYTLPKLWQSGDFRLQIAGLEIECNAVTRIEPLTFNNKLQQLSYEAQRTRQLVPNIQESSNLRVTLPATRAGGFVKWAQETNQGAASGKILEKNGILDFLAPGSSKSFFSFELRRLRIVSTSGPAQGSPSPWTVEMFYDQMIVTAGREIAVG